MHESDFWDLIDRGRRDAAEHERAMVELDEERLVDFYWTLVDHTMEVDNEDLAAHVGKPVSDDTIQHLGAWLVSRGRDEFEAAVDDVERLAELVTHVEEVPQWVWAATRVYRDRFGMPVRFPDEEPPHE